MATKAQAMRRAAELGCKLERDDDAVRLETPAGKVFAGSFVHFFDIYPNGTGLGAWKMPEVWDEMIEEMAMGLDDCEDARANGGDGCEVCDE